MWGLIKIRNFGTVITGTTPPSKKPEQFGEEYPFITPSDMDRSRRVFTERRISAKGAAVHNRKLLPKDSVCFVCIGATIGKICMTTSISLTNQQINSIIVDKSKHDPFFVYYLLSTYSDTVKSLAGGAATPIINKTSFENIEVIVPSLPIQKKIASILSAYDDLIENNTRRIQILEEMAQRIYTEWFVHFRFPGHEKVRMVDSELGKIPEGWEYGKISDYIEFCYGKALKKNDRMPGPFPVYGSSGIIGYHSSCLVKGPGIVVGRKGNVGSVFWTNSSYYPIDTVYYIKSDISLFYIFYNLKGQNFLNNAAAVPGLNRNQAYSLPFIMPSCELIDRFDKFCENLFELVLLLQQKSENLRQTRDLLLPKLISGEIDVSEIPVPEEIAA